MPSGRTPVSIISNTETMLIYRDDVTNLSFTPDSICNASRIRGNARWPNLRVLQDVSLRRWIRLNPRLASDRATWASAPGYCSSWRRRTSRATRVERFGCRAIESFESLHIRIRSKFCQNWKFSKTITIQKFLGTSQHFLECSAKFWKKSSKAVQNSMKIIKKSWFLQRYRTKLR